MEIVTEVSREQSPAGLLSREMQQLWFALSAQRWSTLLIVPAPGVSSVMPLATGLLQISRRSNPEWRSSLIDGTRISLDQVAELAQLIAGKMGKRERALVAVDSVEENPAALALASCCDAALLCVALDGSDLHSSRKTLERCGRGRFLGSVVLIPNNGR
jgi:hypothetical protein